MQQPRLTEIVEALLFSTSHSLKAIQIAHTLELEGSAPVKEAIEELNRFYEKHKRAFRIQEVAGGYLMTTKKEFHPFIGKAKAQKPITLSVSLMESLSVIAYKQPITRAEIDEIRGVDSSYALRSLLDKGLVRVAGKKEVPGRPTLYGTTKLFLEVFGFKNLGELPRPEEFDLFDQEEEIDGLPQEEEEGQNLLEAPDEGGEEPLEQEGEQEAASEDLHDPDYALPDLIHPKPQEALAGGQVAPEPDDDEEAESTEDEEDETLASQAEPEVEPQEEEEEEEEEEDSDEAEESNEPNITEDSPKEGEETPFERNLSPDEA